MRKIKLKNIIISMTRSTTWTTPIPDARKDLLKQFCIDYCPHQDTVCKGDCVERKAFAKSIKKKPNWIK